MRRNGPVNESFGSKDRSLSSVKASGGKLVVIKVGTSSLIHEENGTLKLSAMASIAETLRTLTKQGHRVVIVSSGAVGAGCQRLGIKHRPKELEAKQALASVGQVHLMRYWDDILSANGITCSQVLLTASNMATRSQYLNARGTFLQLLSLGVVPIVNENDTVAVEELRYGDNDTLSAQVAALVHADLLFLLTDVDGLYTANPNKDPEARRIPEVWDIGALADVDTSTSGTEWGTGGMATKLTAARIATAAGCSVVICHSKRPEDIERAIRGESVGTLFHAMKHQLKGSRRWVLAVPTKGRLVIDDGAVRAVVVKRKSLFAAGIVAVHGTFNAHDAVSIVDKAGHEVARCLVNFASADLDRVKGQGSREMRRLLGFNGPEEVAQRDRISCVRMGGGGGGTGSETSDVEDSSPQQSRPGSSMAQGGETPGRGCTPAPDAHAT